MQSGDRKARTESSACKGNGTIAEVETGWLEAGIWNLLSTSESLVEGISLNGGVKEKTKQLPALNQLLII